MNGLPLLLALLQLYPQTPARRCLEARREAIAAALEAGEREYGVPAGLLLATAFVETWVGCHPGEGDGWGAPVDVRHRHTAGTWRHAAAALARSRAVCGTWAGALGRFRSGLCRPWQRAHLGYAPMVLRLTRRVYGRAGASLPAVLAGD